MLLLVTDYSLGDSCVTSACCLRVSLILANPDLLQPPRCPRLLTCFLAFGVCIADILVPGLTG